MSTFPEPHSPTAAPTANVGQDFPVASPVPSKSSSSSPPALRHVPLWHRRSLGWTVLAAMLLVWEVAASHWPSPGLPAPSRIAFVWWQELTQAELAAQLGDTLVSMAYGYAIAAAIGVTLGILMARVRVIYALFEPLVEMMRPVPTIVFIPVIILYLGLGREMNVFAIVISATEPILIASFSGARAVPAQLKDTATTFGLSWGQTLREIVVPSAAPHIFVGLRLALASSLVLAIASGMIAGNSGIGYYILNAQQTLDIARMYAGAFTVGVVGYSLNFLFLWLERRLLHWHVAHDQRSVA